VLELGRHPARLAFAAGAGRGRSVADKEPREPKGELLFSDAARPEQEKTRGQCAAPDGVRESGAKRGMAVQWDERHAVKILRLSSARPRGGR
jgi:hypothetical protein